MPVGNIVFDTFVTALRIVIVLAAGGGGILMLTLSVLDVIHDDWSNGITREPSNDAEDDDEWNLP